MMKRIVMDELNENSSMIDYGTYKMGFRLLDNENDIEALDYLCHSIENDDNSVRLLYDYVDCCLIKAINNPINEVVEIDDRDERFPNNLYHSGYEVNGHEFICNYSGMAGKYWNTICF